MIESLAFFMINNNQSLAALFCMNTVKQLIHFLSVTFDSLDAVCRSSHMAAFLKTAALFPLSSYSQQRSHSSFTYHKPVNVLGELCLSLSPPHIFILKALTLELVHTAMIDSWIWIGEGFQCLDSIGKKPDAYSVDSPPQARLLSKGSAWHVWETQTSGCVCSVC